MAGFMSVPSPFPSSLKERSALRDRNDNAGEYKWGLGEISFKVAKGEP